VWAQKLKIITVSDTIHFTLITQLFLVNCINFMTAS